MDDDDLYSIDRVVMMMEVPLLLDDSETIMPSPLPIIVSAESVVREAASRIGLLLDSSIVDRVCHNLKNELVTEYWQLTMLDSSQWK